MSEKIKKEIYNNVNAPAGINYNWWRVDDKKDVHRHIIAIINNIIMASMYRRIQNLRYARLYANQELVGFIAGLYSRAAADSFLNNRVTLNVIKSVIDTAASKIAKNDPRVSFLTFDQEFALQEKAKKLTRYVDGMFDEINAYEKGQRCFVDGAIWGTGCIKMYAHQGKICAERVLSDELIVDDADGIYGMPRQMFHRKLAYREVLIEKFPKYEKQIKDVPSAIYGEAITSQTADLISIAEAWHLPSGPETGDGRHVICLENGSLFDEEYKKNYFPFVFYRWSPRVTGFYGQGIAEELIGIQLEINKILRNIQLAQHLVAVPRVLMENSSKVNVAHLNNDIGSVVKYTGTRPEFYTPIAMNGEIYNHLENLYNKAYQIIGISQMSANAQKPSGLDSRPALREYHDIESERFILAGKRYEKLYIDMAKIGIDLSRDIYAENKDLKVKALNKKFIQTIPWKEVELDDSQYAIRAFPTSALPSTPAGKIQAVQEYTQNGWIDREYAMSLLDFPDLDNYVSLQTADLDNTRSIISDIVDKGVYNPPEPFMNLALVVKLGQASYLKYRREGLSEEKLEQLRLLIDDAIAMQAKAQEPSPPAQMPPNAPIAQPAARPVSELMPINPQAGTVPAGGI